MIKKKGYLIVLFLCISICSLRAQHLWYENETGTENIEFNTDSNGTFTINMINPDTESPTINPNVRSSMFVREANVSKGFAYFDLFTPLTTASKYTVTLKAYTDVATSDLSSEPNRLRLYLRNTNTNEQIYKQKKFTEGETWEEFSFVFEASEITDGLESGGYNQLYIGFGNGQESTSEITYYIDQIKGSIPQVPLEEVLKGSWGGRFYVRAGEDLDEYVASEADGGKGYDYIAGAQEIADSYPTIGHVITNGTNNANSQ